MRLLNTRTYFIMAIRESYRKGSDLDNEGIHLNLFYDIFFFISIGLTRYFVTYFVNLRCVWRIDIEFSLFPLCNVSIYQLSRHLQLTF